MKVAPEAVLQFANKRGFLADDKAGSTDHGHARTPGDEEIKKGALGALVVFA
jgi:hypothetical protein